MEKKKFLKVVTLLSLLIFLVSCEKIWNLGYKYNTGSLPETPVNLSDFNTEYDDYNSTAPSLGALIPFCFSTNRNSNGEEFDIIYQPMNVNFDKTTGELKITNQYDNWQVFEKDYRVINKAISKIKTAGNEYGPSLIVEPILNEYKFTLLYSTDISGNAQINYVTNLKEVEFSEPREVEFLNSEFDDMYPTFNADKSRIYFCSNRAGEKFDFFYVNVNPLIDSDSLLSGNSSYEILKETTLSSISDDKCPFVFENKIVFSSNRAGGYGGFDLYYSELVNGEWSAPINFGSKINTEYDEYRPILVNEEVSETQTMMIFSSNRAGGKGGFDLYFVGVK